MLLVAFSLSKGPQTDSLRSPSKVSQHVRIVAGVVGQDVGRQGTFGFRIVLVPEDRGQGCQEPVTDGTSISISDE